MKLDPGHRMAARSASFELVAKIVDSHFQMAISNQKHGGYWSDSPMHLGVVHFQSHMLFQNGAALEAAEKLMVTFRRFGSISMVISYIS